MPTLQYMLILKMVVRLLDANGNVVVQLRVLQLRACSQSRPWASNHFTPRGGKLFLGLYKFSCQMRRRWSFAKVRIESNRQYLKRRNVRTPAHIALLAKCAMAQIIAKSEIGMRYPHHFKPWKHDFLHILVRAAEPPVRPAASRHSVVLQPATSVDICFRTYFSTYARASSPRTKTSSRKSGLEGARQLVFFFLGVMHITHAAG